MTNTGWKQIEGAAKETWEIAPQQWSGLQTRRQQSYLQINSNSKIYTYLHIDHIDFQGLVFIPRYPKYY